MGEKQVKVDYKDLGIRIKKKREGKSSKKRVRLRKRLIRQWRMQDMRKRAAAVLPYFL